MVLDGEVVALDGAQTSFARLQQRGERPVAVFYSVFDLLRLAGHDVTALPLRARTSLLLGSGADGRLRHPRFLGLRDDKGADEVVRE